MKKLSVFLCAMVLVFGIVGNVNAFTQFNDGGVHNIDYVISDEVWVDYNTPGVQTTIKPNISLALITNLISNRINVGLIPGSKTNICE